MLIGSGLGPVRPDLEAAEPVTLPVPVRNHLGIGLQQAFLGVIASDPPQHLLDLIETLERTLASRTDARGAAFRDGLTATLPALHAFAQSLTGNTGRADDLVQEALLKAWANQDRFVPGTNLKAWLFTILRNQFYSECRKHRREVEDVDGVIAGQMVAPAAQEHGSDLQLVLSLMEKLPPLQRDALVLVGAQGLTYEAAAVVMGCQTGTVKSRVSRARAYLAERMEPRAASASA